MITLKVADYCHNCPGFEAAVEKEKQSIYGDFELSHYEYITTVSCKYRGRCEAIHNYIQKQIEKESKE